MENAFTYNELLYEINPDGKSVTLVREPGFFGTLPVLGKVKIWEKLIGIKHLIIPQYVLDKNGKKYEVVGIGHSIFIQATQLESIQIPSGVSRIEWSFWGCDNLREIHIAPDNKVFCDVEGVVYSKYKERLCIVPPAYPTDVFKVLPSTYVIDDYAFKHTHKLKTIRIPQSVTVFGISVFSDCRAQEVFIDGTLNKIPENHGDYGSPAIFHYKDKKFRFKKDGANWVWSEIN